MNDKLNIYIYNVRFGECILVEVPDGGKKRYILVDAGNWQTGYAGENKPLLDALSDIHTRTGGKIDLYVMTHEHMDHVEGLKSADSKGCHFDINTVWMTASSEPGYYDKFTDAREKKKMLQDAVKAFRALYLTAGLAAESQAFFKLNATSTVDCVKFIREAGHKDPYYVYQGCELNDKHPFSNIVGLRILAPEQDTSVYYKSLLDSIPRFNLAVSETPSTSEKELPLPLPGVDGGVFYDLIGRMDGNLSESIFAIDKAENDTSIVFELTWHRRRLLFTGDAEEKSWEKMVDNPNLEWVDFFKIGHHGSSTARPPLAALNKILPKSHRKKAVAAVSTFPGDPFRSIPDTNTLYAIKERTTRVYSTTEVAEGNPVIVTLKAAD